MIRHLLPLPFLLLLPGGGLAQEPADTGDPITASTWISQSAVWPGDRIEYTVRLVLSPSAQLAEQDLSGAGVAWAPFRLVDAARRDDLRPDGVRVVTLTYRLAAVDLPPGGSGAIPTLRVTYFRTPDGPTARDDFPMEETSIPGPSVAFRSTLVGSVEDATLRDGKDLEEGPLPGRALLLVGLGGLALGAYPLGRSAWPLARRLMARPHALEARSQKKHLRDEVAELHAMSLDGPQDYERLCRGIHDVLREHLEIRYDVRYPGLTSEDAGALGRAGVPADVAVRVEALVRTCEELRYGARLPEGAHELARQAVGSLDGVVTP